MLGYYSYKTGILKVTGKDKLDFFNRISTNKLSSFPEMTFLRTVFPNDKGRIIDFCTILNCIDCFYLISTPGNVEKLKTHIEKYTVTEDINVIMEFGIISYFTGDEFAFKELKPGSNDIIRRGGSFIYSDNYGFPKTAIIEIGETDHTFIKKLSQGADKISDRDFGISCMKYFHLYSQNELNDKINPLECYLEDYISFDKGCYIGQEVISRIHSQGKVAKCLINIESSSIFSDGDLIYAVKDNHFTECGNVTTSLGKDGKYFGYGFIKTNVLQYDSIYLINGNEIFINHKHN